MVLIVVALITAVIGPLVMLWVGRRVGKPNGHGSVIDMLTTILEDVQSLRAEIRAHIDDDAAHRG